MRGLDDIIVGNAQWETRYAYPGAIRQKTAEAKLLPRLRSLWGDGPSDAELLTWYRDSDKTTRSLFQ